MFSKVDPLQARAVIFLRSSIDNELVIDAAGNIRLTNAVDEAQADSINAILNRKQYDRGKYGQIHLRYDYVKNIFVVVKATKNSQKQQNTTQSITEAQVLKKLGRLLSATQIDRYNLLEQNLYNGWSLSDLLKKQLPGQLFTPFVTTADRPFIKLVPNKTTFSMYQLSKIFTHLSIEFLSLLESGVIHHDIKPENIILTPKLQCYAVDFGMSQVIGGPINTAFQGTPVFMAPEIYESHKANPSGAKPYSEKSMIYALGVIICLFLYPGNYNDFLNAIARVFKQGKAIKGMVTQVSGQGSRKITRRYVEYKSIYESVQEVISEFGKQHENDIEKYIRINSKSTPLTNEEVVLWVYWQMLILAFDMVLQPQEDRPTLNACYQHFRSLRKTLKKTDINQERIQARVLPKQSTVTFQFHQQSREEQPPRTPKLLPISPQPMRQ